MIKVTNYDCHDDYVEVAIDIRGKEYKRKMCVSQGKRMPDRHYWLKHKGEIIKRALGLFLEREKDLQGDIQVIREIEKMRSVL